MATATDEMTQGVFVTGEFLAVKPGRQWTGQDGKTRNPHKVLVLVRDQSRDIEYRDEASALAAVGAAQRGDVLTLPVFPRAVKDRVFFNGVNARD